MRDGHDASVISKIDTLPSSGGKCNFSNRNKEIAKHALTGQSFKEVGAEFGIGAARVHAIYQKAIRLTRHL